MGKTIGVIAIKGGVGKTTTTSTLGAILSKEYGKKVLIIDGNFSAANLGLHFGIVNPEHTIQEVLAGKKKISNAILEHNDNLHIIAASVVPKKIDPLRLKDRLRDIKKDYDIILIDSSPALNEEILATMMAADELLVVTTPDYPTLSCTMHAVKVAKKRGTPIKGLVLNKVRNKNYELTIDDIESMCEAPVLAVMPDDIKVLEALSMTTPYNEHAPYADAAIEMKKLAGALVGVAYEDPRIVSKVRKLFSRSLSKQETNRAEFLE